MGVSAYCAPTAMLATSIAEGRLTAARSFPDGPFARAFPTDRVSGGKPRGGTVALVLTRCRCVVVYATASCGNTFTESLR